MSVTKESYFQDLATMFITQQGVLENTDYNELWFDVTDINGKDFRMIINKLNEELKRDGLITTARIYGMGEGHIWFTDKGMEEINRLKTNLT